MHLNQTLTLKDGRTLGYAEVGNTQGEPLFLFHGLHSSRLEVLHMQAKVQEANIRLIGIDRAGMGLSTFQEGRTLFSTVDDVLALAKHLDIDKFSVVGTSSGGKYALACAYKIPERLYNVFCLSSAVPVEYANDDIGKVNTIALKVMRKAPWLIKPLFWLSYARLSQNPKQVDTFLNNITLPLDEVDKTFLFEDMQRKQLFVEQFSESYRQGVEGNAYDVRFDIFTDSWGFKLEEIAFKDIYIWHGGKDNGVPLSMAKALEKQIPHSHFKVLEDEGHLTLVFRVMDEVMEYVKKIN